LDRDFSRFVLPPGRSSVFTGIKKTTLIDSTYNASLDAAVEMIHLLDLLDAPTKWLVVSDVLEQGSSERRNHEQLAMTIAGAKVDKIIVMGPRMIKYAVPTLEQQRVKFTALETPKEVLDVLKDQIQGGETILFKGTRFLEGVVEHLLANPADAARLCRREAIWHKRRTAWGL
jgi:UDP-N-acetylmuramyl pentapeptide synthase